MSRPNIDYPFPEPPVAGALTQVAPGVLWLRMALPWSLNHINLWLLEDGAGYAIVDTGLGNEECRAQWTQILTALSAPVSKIIVTHFHPDHLGNAEWLAAQSGAPIWMSTGEYLLAHALYNQNSGYDVASMIAHFRHHGLAQERLNALAARGNVFRRGVPSLPTSYRRMIHGDRIEVGAHAWTAIAGHGHSHEHIALHCATLGVLISGDMLLPRITTNVAVPATMPEEDSVGRYLASLRQFEPLPADTLVLPSHGLPFRSLHARVRQLFVHHDERDEVLLAALDEPHSAAELLSVLFPRPLDNHELMFAMGEAIAHLNHQWLKGTLQKFESADGTLQYRRHR